MPFENLNSIHYSAAEKTAVATSLTALETSLVAKFKNLSSEERLKYGSINEQNKLIVNKVRDFRNNQPNLSSSDVDWAEFQTDYDSRDFIQATIARLQNMIDGLANNKILHDYDNYQRPDIILCKLEKSLAIIPLLPRLIPI
jgi:patatin-like phospholipase/acyl hydrolase